jgi:SAM-dependent methyltransferase
VFPRPSHDDSSKLDFVEGMRAYNYQHLVKPLLDDFPERVGRVGVAEPRTKEEAGALYATDPQYLFACAVQRTMQQIGWATAVEGVHRDCGSFTSELDEYAGRQEHGTIELDPDLNLPGWYTAFTERGRDDIHLVPGGYWGDDLVGPVYDRGGAVYRLAWRAGYDARPGALETFVRTAPPGDYRRVVDLGCSFGGLTRVLRKAFPDAEVTGVDLSAPALKYAHYLAESAGQNITYTQRDASDTHYEDESVDLVSAFLLLHEVPDDVRAAIMAEAHRILKPGGHIMFLDIPPYSVLSPVEAYFESFDGRGNGENHWEEFLASDFRGLLESAGFTDVLDGPLMFDEPGYWGSSALWRTGEFNPVHRWTTRATKPAQAAVSA